MYDIVLFIPKHLNSEQRQMLSDVLLRMATAHIVPIIVTQTPTLEELAQKLFEETERKIFELKKISFQDIKVPELIITDQNKQQKYRERYVRNQVNKVYNNQKKICFNRAKCK